MASAAKKRKSGKAEKTPPKKRGRKPKLDTTLVAATLAELQGNVMATAKRFGVDRTSVRDLIEREPTLQKVLHDAREGMKDHAESALYAAATAGEAWAVCFFLKTQARDRGYIERQEVDNKHTVTLAWDELCGFADGLRVVESNDPVEAKILEAGKAEPQGESSHGDHAGGR